MKTTTEDIMYVYAAFESAISAAKKDTDSKADLVAKATGGWRQGRKFKFSDWEAPERESDPGYKEYQEYKSAREHLLNLMKAQEILDNFKVRATTKDIMYVYAAFESAISAAKKDADSKADLVAEATGGWCQGRKFKFSDWESPEKESDPGYKEYQEYKPAREHLLNLMRAQGVFDNIDWNNT